MSNKVKIIIIAIVVLFSGYFLLRLTLFKYIQPDETGVWMTNGGMNGMADYQTWTGHFPVDFNPLTKSFILPAQPWTYDLPQATVYSKENGGWLVDPQFTFSIIREQAPFVCWKYSSYLNGGKEKFLENVAQYILTPLVNNQFLNTLGSNRDTFMMAEKMKVSQIIEDSLRLQFNRYGFRLENFVTGITPPKSILESVNAKNESLQSVWKAKADVEQANAQAFVKVAEAKANAEAMLVTARAEAEAIRLKQQSLSPLIIQSQWIERWDGHLPQYQTGGAAIFQMPIPK